jgi:hypothetical protein
VERALLAFDRKAVSAPISEDLRSAGIKVFTAPDLLTEWLASKGVTLTVSVKDAAHADSDGRS